MCGVLVWILGLWNFDEIFELVEKGIEFFVEVELCDEFGVIVLLFLIDFCVKLVVDILWVILLFFRFLLEFIVEFIGFLLCLIGCLLFDVSLLSCLENIFFFNLLVCGKVSGRFVNIFFL